MRFRPHFFFPRPGTCLKSNLPDGSIRSYPDPLTVADVAASIGCRLAKAALAGKVDGKLVDTSFVIDRNVELAIVTDRDAEGLEIIRHSTAHLLAYAVKELFPDAQVTIGPVIENGFYYDFAYKRPFYRKTWKPSKAHGRAGQEIFRSLVRSGSGTKRQFFLDRGALQSRTDGKAIPAGGEQVSFTAGGDFIDLCRGPHVPTTSKLKVFKLMKVAGAYWRGDSKKRCCSASTAPPGRRRKSWKPTCTCWKRRKNAITAVWASSRPFHLQG